MPTIRIIIPLPSRRMRRITALRVLSGVALILLLDAWVLIVGITEHYRAGPILVVMAIGAVFGGIGTFIGVRLSKRIFDRDDN